MSSAEHPGGRDSSASAAAEPSTEMVGADGNPVTDGTSVGEGSADATALPETDRRILAIEGRTYRYVGAKERRIREDLGMTPTAYFVRLNALIDNPAALRAAPAVVNRLRERRVSAHGNGEDGADAA